MPIYEYECSTCGCRFEVRQSFSDNKPPTECQTKNCQGSLRRVFSPPAIIFKGSGFHVNDYGRSGRSRKTADVGAGAGSSSGESKSSTSKDD